MSLADQNKVWSPTHVKVVVLQARGLRAKGKEATNDAYVIMQLGKEKYSCSVKEKSQDPIWREEAEFELPAVLQGNPEKCTLRLTVNHRALVGLDKFLGQASIDLSELSDRRSSLKTSWYPLRSKPGKKQKERGEIEVDIRFVRNSMTASMFDLSVKDKSRGRLGKLRDRVTGGGKKKGASDSASAIVPCLTAGDDSDGERPDLREAPRKSKLRTLFAKPSLQRTSLSQSLSVLPTGVHPGGAEGNFTEIKLRGGADEDIKLHVPKIMTHKRTASADTKQPGLLPSSNAKREGLGLFGGLWGKPDSGSQSNLCINGSHVYSEEPGSSLQPKNQATSRSMQNLAGPFSGSVEDLRYPTYRARGSTENLAPGPAPTAPDVTEPKGQEPPEEGKRGGGFLDLATGNKASETSRATKEAESAGEETASTRSGALKVPADGKREEIKREEIKREEIKREEIKREEIKREEIKREEIKREENKKEENKKEEGRKGFFSLVTGKSEAKKPEAPAANKAKESVATSVEEEEGRKPAGNSIWASRPAASKPKLDVPLKAETQVHLLPSPPPSSPPPSSPPPSSPPPPSASVGNFPKPNPITSTPQSEAEPAEPSGSANDFARLHLTFSPPPTLSQRQRSSLREHPVLGHADRHSAPQFSPSPVMLVSEVSPPLADPTSFRFPVPGEDWECLADESRGVDSRGGFHRGMRQEATVHALAKTGRRSSSEVETELKDRDWEELRVDQERARVPTEGPRVVQPADVFAHSPFDTPTAAQRGYLSEVELKVETRPKVLHKPPPIPAPRKVTRIQQDVPGAWAALGLGQTQEDPSRFSQDPPLLDEDLMREVAEQSSVESPGEAAKKPSGVERKENIGLVAEVQEKIGDVPSRGSEEEEEEEEEWEVIGTSEVEPTPGPGNLPAVLEKWEATLEADLVSTAVKSEGPGPWKSTEETGDGSQWSTAKANDWLDLRSQDLGNREPARPGNSIARVASSVEGNPFGIPAPGMLETARDTSTEPSARSSDPVGGDQGEPGPRLPTDPAADPGDDEVPSLRISQAYEELPPNRSVAKQRAAVLANPIKPVASLDSDRFKHSSPVTATAVATLRPSPSPPSSPPPLSPSLPLSPRDPHLSGQERASEARVLPTETRTSQGQASVSGMPSAIRPHPVKPLVPGVRSIQSLEGRDGRSATVDPAAPSEPEAAYAQLTRAELVHLLLRQKETALKKDEHIRELEDYIDNLLVRVMETTPSILRTLSPYTKKAERV